MSLVTVHTLKVDGQDSPQLVALNTEKIGVLSEVDGRAHFQFTPFTGRTHEYDIAESASTLFNIFKRPGVYSSLDIEAIDGTVTVTRTNLLMVYEGSSNERSIMQTVSGTVIDTHVVKERMLELVWYINANL